MYGIGNRLDSSPELLFALRGVDHRDLIEQAIPKAPTPAKQGTPTIETSELGAIFGIEIDDSPSAEPPNSKTTTKKATGVKKATVATKPATVKQATETKTTKVKKATATAKKRAAATTKKKATPATRKG